jgi:hypothetical protein
METGSTPVRQKGLDEVSCLLVLVSLFNFPPIGLFPVSRTWQSWWDVPPVISHLDTTLFMIRIAFVLLPPWRCDLLCFGLSKEWELGHLSSLWTASSQQSARNWNSHFCIHKEMNSANHLWELGRRLLPSLACRWESSPAENLLVAMWDPQQRTQFSYAETSWLQDWRLF